MDSEALLAVLESHFRGLGDRVVVTPEYVEVRRALAIVRIFPATPGALRYVSGFGLYFGRWLLALRSFAGLVLLMQVYYMAFPIPREVEARWLLGIPILLVLLFILEGLEYHHPRTVDAIQLQAELALAAARIGRALGRTEAPDALSN